MKTSTEQEQARGAKGTLTEVTMPLGEYQIWRLLEAVQVNSHGKQPITLKVFDDEGTELTNLVSLRKK